MRLAWAGCLMQICNKSSAACFPRWRLCAPSQYRRMWTCIASLLLQDSGFSWAARTGAPRHQHCFCFHANNKLRCSSLTWRQHSVLFCRMKIGHFLLSFALADMLELKLPSQSIQPTNTMSAAAFAEVFAQFSALDTDCSHWLTEAQLSGYVHFCRPRTMRTPG